MKKKLLTMASVCLILALVALSVVSCGEVTPGPTPEPGPEPQYGGVLRIATGSDATQLGVPWDFRALADFYMGEGCIETLIHIDEAGNPIPWLATSWELSEDRKSLTLTLRKGVKFHDGTNFRADAVKLLIDGKIRNRPDHLPGVTSIDIIDDYTVRLNLSEYSNILVGERMVIHTGIASPTAFHKYGEEWLRQHPVGTGPFKFVSWDRDVSIKFERFDDYWQEGKPYLDGIEWVIITDPMVALASFLKGDVDVCLDPDPKDVAALKARGEYSVMATPLLVRALYHDSANADSPFADIRVRRACGHAIDTKAIVDRFFYGYAEASSQFIAPSSSSYNPDVVGTPYNPTKAKQLLAEAGYPEGFKTVLTCLNDPMSAALYVAVQGYLKEVGIDAQVDLATKVRQVELYRQGWSGLLDSNYTGAHIAMDLIVIQWFTKTARSMMEVEEMLSLAQKSMMEPDWQTKLAMCRELQVLAMDKYCLYNPVVVCSSIAVSYKEVHDTGLRSLPHPYCWTPSDAWLER